MQEENGKALAAGIIAAITVSVLVVLGTAIVRRRRHKALAAS